ncbi:MAG: ATP phosphoribosyltransferase regulatory subunit [Betaproteobacteria bacterium]|nr:ATP phosphoribosyltransferase regulatory subunit [Betaproteobacteria bacterium]
MRTWALPEHIEDVLPADAAKLEHMRRTVLDGFAAHGYQLVTPPLLEYVDSLLTGTGHDMDLATFKLVDQLSGRTMGIRADTTPQVARIDAHVLNRQGIARLCYAGSVLHTLPAGLGKSRQPFQAGAEMYGCAGLDADIEIQQLMIDALTGLGVPAAQLDIGHPAIYRVLIELSGLGGDAADEVFAAIEAKDAPGVASLAGNNSALAALPGLYGGVEVLARARQLLPADARIENSLGQLQRIHDHFSAQGIVVSIDLAELGGFNYESGIVFSAFAAGAADAVARGGRYDEIGKAFGRARPATGFSMDLKSLLPLVRDVAARGAILAPRLAGDKSDTAAQAEMARLRAAGEVVIGRLAGDDAHLAELGCDREMIFTGGRWTLVPLK